MQIPKLANQKKCTGCLSCVDACPKKALHKVVKDDGHIYVECDNNLCVACHKCELVCPVVSCFEYTKEASSQYYAGWCTDSEVRRKSATAGAFAAIAMYVIDKGGYVFGATIDDVCDVKHICVCKIEDIKKIQGSKYTQSDASNSYSHAFELLKGGCLVFFTGTGCQVAGLLSFLKDKKYEGKLVTADLVCGGVPSKLLLEKFIENEPYKVKKIISFRTKDKGWKPNGFRYNLKVLDADGEIHDYTGKRTLLTDGFSSELTNRYSCYCCQFAGSSRQSDFSFGDLWGTTLFPEQHYEGVSLIIAHNLKADALLKDAKKYLESHAIDAENAIKNNYRILSSHSRLYLLPERKLMSFFFRKYNYETLKKIYAWDYPNYSPWIFYKIIRWFMNKLLK